jgi:hypothetical protein
MLTVAMNDGPLTLHQKYLASLNSCFYEIAQYGRLEYNVFVEKLKIMHGRLHIRTKIPTYEKMWEKILKTTETPWSVADIYDVNDEGIKLFKF